MRLTTRVAWTSAFAAAVGGAVAAIVVGVAARELSRRHDDTWVLGLARDLATELDEELHDEDGDIDEGIPSGPRSLGHELAHELDDDIRVEGARAVVRTRGRTGGDLLLPDAPIGECEEHEIEGISMRLCTVEFEEGTLTLAVDDTRGSDQRRIFALATVLGIAAAAVVAALLSARSARWALTPLVALRDRVRSIRPDAVDSLVIGDAISYPELEELRSALVDSIARVRAALDTARAFSAEASHELRTPLTTVRAELELLEESASARDRSALARVRRRVSSLSELVERLLILARPVPTSSLTDAVDLDDVLSAVLGSLDVADAARVRSMCADDVLVRGDAPLLQAMVANALDNALKFSTGIVDVCVWESSGRCVMAFSDDGPGISSDERGRVFEPFYRAVDARASATPGHGVGLALIARVAAIHGGTASFMDVVRGARLEISLPRWFGRSTSATPD